MLTKRGASPIELLERDGFVVGRTVPLDTVDELRRAIDEVAVASIVAPGETTHRYVQLPTESLKPLLLGLPSEFAGFEVVAALAALGKPAQVGAASEDWIRQATVVAKDAGKRAIVAYVGLSGETGPQGQLRVVRNSHRFSASDRSVGTAGAWSAHAKRLDRVAVDLPLEPGGTVIMDPAVVWSRYLNHSPTERVGVYLLMVEPNSTVVRYGGVHAESSEHELAGQPVRLAHDIDVQFEVASQEVTGSRAEWIRLQAALYSTRVSRMALLVRFVRGLMLAPGRAWVRLQAAAAGCLSATQSGFDRVAAFWRPVNQHRPKGAKNGKAMVGSARKSARRLATEGQRVCQKAVNLAEFAPSAAALGLLHVNEWVICRFGPKTPAVWDPSQFDWTAEVEDAWPAIRAEVEELLNHRKGIPHIKDVTGGVPQGDEGAWRTFVLMHRGAWVDWNCSRCPETTRTVRRIPHLSMAGFSILEPRTHITEHRGLNRGALRYQLGVIVPGVPGDCRIRVGDDTLYWRDGESVIFDLIVPHEAWNDTGENRVLLELEFCTPLPAYLALPNSMVQHCMAWFPAARDMERRLSALGSTAERGRRRRVV